MIGKFHVLISVHFFWINEFMRRGQASSFFEFNEKLLIANCFSFNFFNRANNNFWSKKNNSLF